MTFLYNQPLAHRFGVALVGCIEGSEWQSFEAAVAWVRRSGTQHLIPSLRGFLRRGGSVQITVGVDIENTSEEGLQDLLDLGTSGRAEIFVYHNEFEVTFHPKVYLFTTTDRARLIVGSNNLTEAGLYANTEAGLQIDGRPQDPVMVEARQALESWRDPAEKLVRPLDAALLADLVREGYVFSERVLRQRRRQATEGRARSSRTRQLFARKRITVPSFRPVLPQVGLVLLMRVRRASETARRTQVQLPIRVVRTQFFQGANELISGHDGRRHAIVQASARGGINTLKVEIPEIEPMNEPVLRLERAPTGIVYEVYDAGSVLGWPIMDALRIGLRTTPPTTSLTLPSKPHRSTWFRFI